MDRTRHLIRISRVVGAVLLGAWIAFCLTALALFIITFTFV